LLILGLRLLLILLGGSSLCSLRLVLSGSDLGLLLQILHLLRTHLTLLPRGVPSGLRLRIGMVSLHGHLLHELLLPQKIISLRTQSGGIVQGQ
jgi:hypothetical protein